MKICLTSLHSFETRCDESQTNDTWRLLYLDKEVHNGHGEDDGENERGTIGQNKHSGYSTNNSHQESLQCHRDDCVHHVYILREAICDAALGGCVKERGRGPKYVDQHAKM